MFSTLRAGLAVALTLALTQPQPAKADEFLNVLTGGTSGVYYPMGVALAKVFSDKIPGTRPGANHGRVRRVAGVRSLGKWLARLLKYIAKDESRQDNSFFHLHDCVTSHCRL